MIDHILVYPTAQDRDAAWPAPEGSPPAWTDEGRDTMPARIVHQRATYGEDGEQTAPDIVAPGSWLVIRTVARDQELEAMAEAVITVDADRAARGDKYVIKCTLAPETILGQVEPVWAGSEYSIPVGQPASVLDDWRIEE